MCVCVCVCRNLRGSIRIGDWRGGFGGFTGVLYALMYRIM